MRERLIFMEGNGAPPVESGAKPPQVIRENIVRAAQKVRTDRAEANRTQRETDIKALMAESKPEQPLSPAPVLKRGKNPSLADNTTRVALIEKAQEELAAIAGGSQLHKPDAAGKDTMPAPVPEPQTAPVTSAVEAEDEAQPETIAGIPAEPAGENTTKTTLTDDEINQAAKEVNRYVYNREMNDPEAYHPFSLLEGREAIDPEVGKHFDAHGMMRGTYAEQLQQLDNLLTNGIDKDRPFHTLPLKLSHEQENAGAALGAVGPYDTGSFIVISHPDQMLKDEGIAAVAANDHFYSVIPLLEQRFPNVKFIKGEDLPQETQGMLTEAQNTTTGADVLAAPVPPEATPLTAPTDGEPPSPAPDAAAAATPAGETPATAESKEGEKTEQAALEPAPLTPEQQAKQMAEGLKDKAKGAELSEEDKETVNKLFDLSEGYLTKGNIIKTLALLVAAGIFIELATMKAFGKMAGGR